MKPGKPGGKRESQGADKRKAVSKNKGKRRSTESRQEERPEGRPARRQDHREKERPYDKEGKRKGDKPAWLKKEREERPSRPGRSFGSGEEGYSRKGKEPARRDESRPIRRNARPEGDRDTSSFAPRKRKFEGNDSRKRNEDYDHREGSRGREIKRSRVTEGEDYPKRRRFARDTDQEPRENTRSREPNRGRVTEGEDYPKRRRFTRDADQESSENTRSREPKRTRFTEGEDYPKRRRTTSDEDRPRRTVRKPTNAGRPARKKEEGPFTKPGRYHGKEFDRPSKPSKKDENRGEIRLNKYIADAGICSRREADDLIVSGAVKVNGVVVSVLGTKIFPTDKVQIGDQTLSRETLRYVLLNKPKGYITTLEDPEGRKTVMFLIREACRERIYPVGRLDRNTTGVLLFTNDGEMAKKLTHPRYGIRKMYHVVLDQPLSPEHMKTIEEGIELEDGFIKVDAIAYVGDAKDRRQLGVEIHSGKNRIVRRIFEELGYTINSLDRVIFAGLTKKDLPRGRWRHLTKEEVNFLKMQG